ncbi:putative methyltransferase for Ribosomal protein L11 [Parasynechococcus marenigrum WH 8102]|uniref:Ribosomal protein L11 methyltransferase n=2 Tax=Parasynechococcus TaxID=2881427 RepID=PRMA_PARMW|nr:RecName: Full=Ribosomal protein L11 methyltransferase; Short=L11 Mtase [Parasynechococcus marenigrum WH 8102]CAE07049.1 putative methyltransferase for Ribosomal protein L11 [Parasynechococcus marenigrum WH 8102]
MACPPELEESLVWKLTDLGLHRHAVQHAPETPDRKQLLLWLPQPEWPEAERQQLLASLEPLAEPFGLPLPQGHWDDVADEDWSLSWKQHWQPDPVGEGLLILPAWLEVPPEHGERLVIRMDPGSAFGTGSHPTTRLCLEALEKAPPVGALVADLGCGSGVLGLAALGLGATAVVAADTDSLAVRATGDNRELNGRPADLLKVSLGSVEALQHLLEGRRADLLLCNILAPVIEALAPGFEALVAPEGRALLSGLLVDQAPRLEQVLGDLGWRVSARGSQGRWGLLEIQRR